MAALQVGAKRRRRKWVLLVIAALLLGITVWVYMQVPFQIISKADYDCQIAGETCDVYKGMDGSLYIMVYDLKPYLLDGREDYDNGQYRIKGNKVQAESLAGRLPILGFDLIDLYPGGVDLDGSDSIKTARFNADLVRKGRTLTFRSFREGAKIVLARR